MDTAPVQLIDGLDLTSRDRHLPALLARGLFVDGQGRINDHAAA